MATLFLNATLLPMCGEGARTFTGSVGVAGNRIALVTSDEGAVAQFRAAHPGLREIDCRAGWSCRDWSIRTAMRP